MKDTSRKETARGWLSTMIIDSSGDVMEASISSIMALLLGERDEIGVDNKQI